MPICKKPDFKKICTDIDMDKLFMTERPAIYPDKWKEACRKNLSGKDGGIFSKKERSWTRPDNYSVKQWYALTSKQRGKIIKQQWKKAIEEYKICSAQQSYKKGQTSLKQILNKPPPLPASLSSNALKEIGIDISPSPPPPPPVPTHLLPPPPASPKRKTLKPKKPPKRKSRKLYTGNKQISTKTAEIWGNFIHSPHTTKRTKIIPPPRTPEGSPTDDWDDYS